MRLRPIVGRMVSPLAPASAVVALTLFIAPAALAQSTHVRAMTPMARAAVTHGIAQSPSFRALVERLERSDVVVYVRDERGLTPKFAARLTFVAAAGGTRYVMVGLSRRLTPSQQVATLGHELQHAVEIAERPSIVDTPSLAGEYASLAIAKPQADAAIKFFETARALAAAQQILGEMIR
jgi:hypothetical protein